MFVLLFVVAILQMTLLPGLLVLRLVRANDLSPIVKYTLATMLSIIANYAICLTLIILNIFTQGMMLAIVALECGVLAFIYYKNYPITYAKNESVQSNSLVIKTSSDVINAVGYAIALGVIILLLSKFLLEPSNYIKNFFNTKKNYLSNYIFMGWDDIKSWNNWAVDLFNSTIPSNTAGGYPIAIPAWWAVGYRIVNYPFEPLPKLISTLWLPLTLPLLLIDYGYLKRQLSIMFSGVILAILWFKTKNIFLGLVDIPLATIGFTALFLLVENAKTANKSLLILATILSLTSPVIKANGFFIVVAFAVGFYLLCPLTIKAKLKYSLFYLVALIAIVVSWYAWWFYNLSIGETFSNLGHVTRDIYNGKSELDRAITGFKSLFQITNYWFIPLAILSFFAKGRAYLFLAYFGLAYLAYWACYISYDLRNGFLSWPFLVVSGMIVLERLVATIYVCYKNPVLAGQLYQQYSVKFKIYIRIIMVIVIAMFIAICLLYPKERVINKFNQLLLERGGNAAKELDRIFTNDPTPKKILTNITPIMFRGHLSLWSNSITLKHSIKQEDLIQYDYIIWRVNKNSVYYKVSSIESELVNTEVIVIDGNITLYKVIH